MQDTNRLEIRATSTVKSNILGGVLAIISSIALFGLVIFNFGPRLYVLLVEVSFGVTTGHPLWKTFQSRVLGPYIVKALSFGSSDHYVTAYVCFHIVTVAIAAFLCWRLGKKYGGNDQSAFLALTLFVGCFVSFLGWLYSWDIIDIIVFAVFIDFVLSGKTLPWFLGLFAIAIWNRDSANFIALWLILHPLVRFFYQRRYKLPKTPPNWHWILAGAICIGAGLIIAEMLKRNLLIEGMAPKQLAPQGQTNFGNRYNLGLPYNIAILKHSLFAFWFWIALPFLAVAISLGAKFARLDPQRYLALYLIELSLMAALFLFAEINELRIYYILVPFLVISAVFVTFRKGSGQSPSR